MAWHRKKYHEFQMDDERHPGEVWLEIPRERKALYENEKGDWFIGLKKPRR